MSLVRKQSAACPPLFKVRKGGRLFYVLGTDHTLSKSDLPQLFQDLLNDLPNVVGEIRSMQDVLLSEADLRTLGILVDYHSDGWVKRLSAKHRAVLEERCAHFFERWTSLKRIPQLRELNPSLVHQLIPLGNRRGYEGMDNEFLKNAVNSFALENIERCQFLSAVQTSLVELQRLLEESTSGKERSRKLASQQEYLTGKLLSQTLGYITPDNLELVIKRNLRWMVKIIEYYETLENPLFVVGTNHLLGTLGILSLLEKFGFEVTQINAQGALIPFHAADDPADQWLLLRIKYEVNQYVKSAIRDTLNFPVGLHDPNSLVYEYMGHDLFNAPPSFLSRHLDINFNKKHIVEVVPSDEPVSLKLRGPAS